MIQVEEKIHEARISQMEQAEVDRRPPGTSQNNLGALGYAA